VARSPTAGTVKLVKPQCLQSLLRQTTLERWAHRFLWPYDVAARADHGQKQV